MGIISFGYSFISDLKYYLGILAILLVNSLHVIYFNNDNKYDIYLFYNHERYLTNILYDVGVLVTLTILSRFLCNFKRNIFKPLYYTFLFSWLMYFLFYWQMASLFIIPFYFLCIAILTRTKQNKK